MKLLKHFEEVSGKIDRSENPFRLKCDERSSLLPVNSKGVIIPGA
jgi:hypothetical protein